MPASLKRTVRLLAAISLVAGSPWAAAAETWNFADTTGVSTPCSRGESLGNAVTCTTPVTVTAKGWGTTGGAGTAFVAAYLNNQGGNGLGLQSQVGTGLESTVAPYHAFDSIDNTELMSLSFGKSVSLTQVTLGWANTDADFSLLAWTGASAPNLATTIGGQTASGLVSAGWKLVGNYGVAGNAANPDTDVTVNVTNATYSSYWLIGAFNAGFGGPAGVDATGDSWKLLSIAGSAATSVPEPTSLALVCLAVAGAAGVRRRKVRDA